MEQKDLRQKARELLKNKQSKIDIHTQQDLEKVLEELHIHQIELELQNDELRRTQTDLAEAKQKYFDLYNLAPVGYFTLDQRGLITELNLAGARLLQGTRKQLSATPFFVHLDTNSKTEFFNHLKAVKDTQQRQKCEIAIRIKKSPEKLRHLLLESTVIYNENSEDVSYRTSATDITAQKEIEAHLRQVLDEKDVLFKEVHHRVKNNLQVVSSLLSLQEQNITDKEIRKMFQDSGNRIKAMALVHEQLYKVSNLGQIDFGQYLHRLMDNLSRSHQNTNLPRFTLNVSPIQLEVSLAIPCGLIVNELISNAIEHAFEKEKSHNGEIRLMFQATVSDKHTLVITDNGHGLPARMFPDGTLTTDLKRLNDHSLGLQLVKSLIDQINGTAYIAADNGTTVEIVF